MGIREPLLLHAWCRLLHADCRGRQGGGIRYRFGVAAQKQAWWNVVGDVTDSVAVRLPKGAFDRARKTA